MAVPLVEYVQEELRHRYGAYAAFGLPAGLAVPPSPPASDDEEEDN